MTPPDAPRHRGLPAARTPRRREGASSPALRIAAHVAVAGGLAALILAGLMAFAYHMTGSP